VADPTEAAVDRDRRPLFSIAGHVVRRPRGPRRYFDDITAGYALYPLIILFGLNAVDELDRTVFGVLGPEIRDDFGLTNQGYLTLIALTLLGGLLLEVPLAYYADRIHRVRIAVLGAAVWAMFGLFTGFATTILLLVIARSGAGMGRAVVTPTHNSLLSDYYPTDVRTDVFGFHRMANALGAFVGPVVGGLLAEAFGWRVPFFVFVIPSIVFVVLGLRLHEPGRGHHERRSAGATEEVIATDEQPPSWAESVRILWQIRTLRRIWFSLPFLAASVIGLASLTSIYYEEVFNLSESQRGFVAGVAEPAQIVGILLGIPLASRLMLRDAGMGLRLLSVVAVGIAGAWVAFALAPVLAVAIIANILISGLAALLGPGIFASLSLAIPPKVRSLGFSMASLFILPGLTVLYIVGGIADRYGIRQGMLLMVPVFLIGAFILSSASYFVKADISRVWTSTAAQAEVLHQRSKGEVKLLLVRNVDVSYDNVQVLFGVNFEIDEGEIVALLGTNGAGKSTLLKAIAGVVPADGGAIVFDGRDATYAPPHEIAARGIVMVPGGQGVFPSLTVAENLRLAGWLDRDETSRAEAVANALEMFPALERRMQEPAANLSGGQQQMLTLGMALLLRPRLLMIDELSLGLAPSVVAELLVAVQRLKEQGTTVILVEQSVNVALTVAETAYFMEKGEIRFHGPTSELLERPDVLRSVFLEGAASVELDINAPAVVHVNGEVPVMVPTAVLSPNGANGQGDVRVSVHGVSKHFGGIAALDDVSFDVRAGEVLGFLGPNGAGKTTLFDVISGFQIPSQGDIELDGESIIGLGPDARARRGLGRSFQDGRLFPALTVAETIAVALERSIDVRDPVAAALHLPSVVDSEAKVARRVEELIELLGLGAFRDKYIRELSTGSRRVVDLACVLAHGPRVLLLDEPSSGIAQREAEALGPLLLRIRAMTGASLLIIEHDIPLLTSIADRMIALDLGQVVAIGAPADVVRDPDVVASYLGESEAVVSRSGPRGE
jgi:ABC-type branched-subunit amino acid transport system ATPase component/predicted MFS family arabinose efflux permease